MLNTFIDPSPQHTSKFSLTISPGFPVVLDLSAFNILYLSPLNEKKAPGYG